MRFRSAFACRLRRLRPTAHPEWHLDEMFVSIGGRRMNFWRAVDQHGEVLEILVQAKRDKRAASHIQPLVYVLPPSLTPSSLVADISGHNSKPCVFIGRDAT